MSTSIAIPSRSGKQRAAPPSTSAADGGIAMSNNDSIPSSSASSSAEPSPVTNHNRNDKGKMPARNSDWNRTPSTSTGTSLSRTERRVSLLSSSISKSEHTVINIGDPNGPPRLITCVKSSQGFDWNQDMFLPSYASDHDYSAELELRQDPIQDIFISDEEAAEMFPR